MTYPPNRDGRTHHYPAAPPPPPGHPAAAPWPAAPPPRKRSPWLFIGLGVAGVFGLCMVVGVIGALTDDSHPAGKPAAAETGAVTKPAAKKPAVKAPAKAAAGYGDKVRDGKFEFVVTGMDCSHRHIGDGFLKADAQGKFCIVSMTVTNIGDEAQTFSGSDQKAHSGSVEYSNDTSAEMTANEGTETFLEDINPGNSVRGKVVFDVPETVKLTHVELHDSVWSGGVKVNLS